jgi:RES domain-containing protein
LTPPAQPRDDKSLCDTVRIFHRDEALRLLRAGVERGMISEWDGSGSRRTSGR